MTSRKKSGKGKGKRNGRTKRGGFLKKLFGDFSWFGNNSESTETKTGSSGGWFSFSNLFNKFKPPTTPENQTPVIPGKPPQQSSAASLPSASSLPSAASPPSTQQSLSSAASLSPQQQSQVITPSSQTQPQMQPQAPVTAAAAGGKRRRSSIKKRK